MGTLERQNKPLRGISVGSVPSSAGVVREFGAIMAASGNQGRVWGARICEIGESGSRSELGELPVSKRLILDKVFRSRESLRKLWDAGGDDGSRCTVKPAGRDIARR